MRRRKPATAQEVLVIALGLSAFGLGAAASALAAPAAVMRPITSPGAARPVVFAGIGMAGASASVRLRISDGDVGSGAQGLDAIPPGQSREEWALRVGRLAALDATYQYQNARIELVRTASAARRRPLAFLYIEQDWAELVATGSGSLAPSARPRQLAESTGT